MEFMLIQFKCSRRKVTALCWCVGVPRQHGTFSAQCQRHANFWLLARIMPMSIVYPLIHLKLNVSLWYTGPDALYLTIFRNVTVAGKSKTFVHLGHHISADLNDDEDISGRKQLFIEQVNNHCFFSKLASIIKIKLCQSFCTSYYGCDWWSLASGTLLDFCTTWRNSL